MTPPSIGPLPRNPQKFDDLAVRLCQVTERKGVPREESLVVFIARHCLILLSTTGLPHIPTMGEDRDAKRTRRSSGEDDVRSPCRVLDALLPPPM